MSLSVWLRGAALAGVGIAGAAAASPAAAEPAQAQCASAYENAQILRQRGRLLGARDAALTCARSACPEVARKDCASWAEEITRGIPTVVVIARDEATGDERGARVAVDGAPRLEAATGRAFELDPGDHVFRIERAGDQPLEQTVQIFQGERDRILRFTLRPIAAPATPAGTAPPVTPPRTEPPPAPNVAPSSVSYTPAILTTGVAAAFLGVSAALGLSGRNELSQLRTTCAPTCTDSQVDPVRLKLVVSDITLAVGAVGMGAALYLFLRPPSSAPATAARVDVSPSPGGGIVSFRGTF